MIVSILSLVNFIFYVVCTFEQLMNEIDTKTVFKGSEIKNDYSKRC